MSNSKKKQIIYKLLAIFISIIIVIDTIAEAGDKGRDIIIYNGKVIVKSGKKKGNIIISHGDSHEGGQGKYKYKKKYMNYGGFW